MIEVRSYILHLKENIEKKYGKEAASLFFHAASDPTCDGFFQQLGVMAYKYSYFLFHFEFY